VAAARGRKEKAAAEERAGAVRGSEAEAADEERAGASQVVKAKGKIARGDEGKATELEMVGANQGGDFSGISSKTEDLSKIPKREGISAIVGN
jgi:hypothetical protein